MARRVRVKFFKQKPKVNRIVMDAEMKCLVAPDGTKYFAKNQYYRKNKGHMMVFEPISEDERNKVINKITNVFTKKLTAEAIIKEVLERIEYKQLKLIEKGLAKKIKPTVRKGCIEIQVGGQIVTII